MSIIFCREVEDYLRVVYRRTLQIDTKRVCTQTSDLHCLTNEKAQLYCFGKGKPELLAIYKSVHELAFSQMVFLLTPGKLHMHVCKSDQSSCMLEVD